MGIIVLAIAGLLQIAQVDALPAAPSSLPIGCNSQREEEVVVCAPRNRAGDYRLRPSEGFDPAGPVDSVSRERHRLLDVGAAGIGSCSAVGPGGWTGCDAIRWREAQQQYAEPSRRQGISIGLRSGGRGRGE